MHQALYYTPTLLQHDFTLTHPHLQRLCFHWALGVWTATNEIEGTSRLIPQQTVPDPKDRETGEGMTLDFCPL